MLFKILFGEAVSYAVEWDFEFEDMDESAFEESKQAIAEVVAHDAGVDPSAVTVSFTPTTAGVTRRRLTNGVVKAKIEVSDSSAGESMAESLASVTTEEFASELASRVENPPTISAISTPKVEEELVNYQMRLVIIECNQFENSRTSQKTLRRV